MTNPFHDEINRLNKRLDQLTYLIEKQINSGSKGFAKLGLEDKAHDLGRKLRRCCDDWISTSQETVDNIRYGAEEQKERLKETIERHPFKTLGISALIGFILAFLFSRRK